MSRAWRNQIEKEIKQIPHVRTKEQYIVIINNAYKRKFLTDAEKEYLLNVLENTEF